MNHAPIYARVEVVLCPCDLDAEDGGASEAISERRVARIEPVVVRLFSIQKSATMMDTIVNCKQSTQILTMHTQLMSAKNPLGRFASAAIHGSNASFPTSSVPSNKNRMLTGSFAPMF